MADGTLKFDTKIDTKGFEEGVDDLKESADDATDELNNGLDNNEKKLINLKNTAKVVGGVLAGKLFKDALTQGVQFNAQVEQYTATFETFTGSAEKANSVVNQLIEMGAKTPFDFLELADATQKLMSYGFSADEAIGSLTMLGDASQGSAEKLNTITTAYGRMMSSQKVTLEDLNMLIDMGFNPLTKVAENTGMSMAEVYDAISDGKLPVEEVTKAMVQMTSEGGQYFGLMEKQSQTLNGKISTLKDTWNTFLGNAVKPLSDFLGNTLIPVLIEVLGNFEKYEPIFVIVGIAIGNVTSLLIAYNIQQALATANLTLWGAICSGATAVTTALATAFAFLTSPIGLIIIAIGALIAIGYLLIKNWDTVVKVASNVWSAITKAFSNVAKWFDKNVVQPISKAFTNIYNSITQIIDNIVSSVVNFATSVYQAIYNGIVVPITNFVSTWITPLVSKIIEIITKLVEIVVVLFVQLVNLINSTVIQPIISFFVNMYTAIVNAFQSLANWFNSNVVQPVISFFKNMFDSIGNFAQQSWSFITGIFSNVASFFGNVFTSAYQKVTGAFSGIVSFFSGIWGKIKNTFSTLGTSIASAISGAVKSGINSIISKIESTINTAIGLINGAINVINYIPGVNIGKISKLKMPRLEQGGILKKGQVGLLEGNGAEAVVPLDRNKYWVKAVAKEFARMMPQTITNNREQVVNFYGNIENPIENARRFRLAERYGYAR